MALSTKAKCINSIVFMIAGYLPIIAPYLIKRDLYDQERFISFFDLTEQHEEPLQSIAKADVNIFAKANEEVTSQIDQFIANKINTDKQIYVSPIKIIDIYEHKNARIVKGSISSNFYVDAKKLGIPVDVINSTVRNLSGKIDFNRSLKVGDQFEILYNLKSEMLYARIAPQKGNGLAVYRVTTKGRHAYYFENGEKIEFTATNNAYKTFGKPLNGKLSVSDGFGRRIHPMTGKIHHHKGVDLRANHGAQVLAISDGVVTRSSYYGGYGKCIDIKHSSGYASRYAHLSQLQIRVGQQVRRGQIIGRVGSTGSSTGAHLHLELARNNVRMNPMNARIITVKNYKKSMVNDRANFNLLKSQIRQISEI